MTFLYRLIRFVFRFIWWIINKWRFGHIGFRTYIYNPLKISGSKNINLGSKVFIGYKSWLAALPLTGEKGCRLEIGDGSSIGNFNHIFATKKISIGKNVLTADKVYISDNLHNYENIDTPIMNQSIKQIKAVEIGDGTWLGENVCVIGAKIGKNCVIGANSVVTKDIPDYSVAVGIPIKIIKRYCLVSKKWKKTNHNGIIK
jgi:acetyltransferase-like isoleucine patch superfamily enzyme